jgi:hypothetical protein
VGSVSILALMSIIGKYKKVAIGKNIYLSIDIVNTEDNKDTYLERLNDVIAAHTRTNDLRRYDIRPDTIEATYFIDVDSIDNLSSLMDELMRKIPGIGVTFLDQNQLPSL